MAAKAKAQKPPVKPPKATGKEDNKPEMTHGNKDATDPIEVAKALGAVGNGNDVTAAVEPATIATDDNDVAAKEPATIATDDDGVAVPPEEVKESPWKTLGSISDDVMTVQAVPVTGHQKKGCLIRCIVDGKVLGKVEFLHNFIPKDVKGVWTLR